MKPIISYFERSFRVLAADKDRLRLTILDLVALIMVLVSFAGVPWLRDVGGGAFLVSLGVAGAAFMRRYPAQIFGTPPLTLELHRAAWKTGVHLKYAGSEPCTALTVIVSYSDGAGTQHQVRIREFHAADDLQMIAAAKPVVQLQPGFEAYFELPAMDGNIDGRFEVTAACQALWSWTKFQGRAVLSTAGLPQSV